jgi:hypothetical protein
MHPGSAALLSFCDAEGGTLRNRRVVKHLSRCQKCRSDLRRIQNEKEELSAGAATPARDGESGLAGVLSAMAAWQDGRIGVAASSQLRSRLRSQIETYFGFPAVSVLERSAIRPEQLFGKASEILNVFLGPDAGEAVSDDILRGLDCSCLHAEIRR